MESMTLKQLREYCKNHKVKGYSQLQKNELIKLAKKHKKATYTGCKHDWDKRDFIVSQGIVFAYYKCSKCGEEAKQMLGETYRPDMYGNF